jgi:branched-chain amino acid transport system substrate-binding protein
MRPLRRSGFGLAAAVTVLLLSGAAGCGSGSTGAAELSVYLSAPLSGPASGDGRDIADGARLALDEAGGEVGGTRIRLVVRSDADEHGANAAMAGANARRATEDSTAIAYVGELDSGTTRTSLPITNEAGMLQVSAGASAVDLTRSAPGSSQIPSESQPSGSRSFGRVVPSDTAQGAAAAAWMSESGVRSVVAVDAGSAYGQSLLDGLESVTKGPSVAPSESSTDAIYVASDRLQPDLLDTAGEPRIYGADAQLSGSPPMTELPAPARIVSGTLAPAQLPSAAGRFLADFQSAYGRDPGRFAAYGYEAMAVVLDSIGRADDPLDRGSVIDAFFATADRGSILGTYSIDDVGDTTLDRVGAYESRAGALRPAPRSLPIP